MTTFSKAVRDYEKKCAEHGIPAETVMAFLVELSNEERYNLYLHYEEEMPEELEKKFSAGMNRILNHEPMEHVLGYSWFCGYRMIVNPEVLIPRPETEELCGRILARVDRFFPTGEVNVCDVGTGSGAIAIAVQKEEPRIRMSATDVSKEAVEVAGRNAALNGADVHFLVGDMLRPLIEAQMKLDILISNPPYIPEKEQMEKSVVDFEPHVALFGGEDGLKFYRMIFRDCKKVLKERAMMAFEMGWDQKERMSALVKELLPEAQFEIIQDMNGKDRMLFVYLGFDEDIHA